MSSWFVPGIGIFTLFAGVSILALYTRRIGNSPREAGVLVLTGTVLVIGFLSVILFVDRLGLNSEQREWALRIGFVGLTISLWRTSHRMLGKSPR